MLLFAFLCSLPVWGQAKAKNGLLAELEEHLKQDARDEVASLENRARGEEEELKFEAKDSVRTKVHSLSETYSKYKKEYDETKEQHLLIKDKLHAEQKYRPVYGTLPTRNNIECALGLKEINSGCVPFVAKQVERVRRMRELNSLQRQQEFDAASVAMSEFLEKHPHPIDEAEVSLIQKIKKIPQKKDELKEKAGLAETKKAPGTPSQPTSLTVSQRASQTSGTVGRMIRGGLASMAEYARDDLDKKYDPVFDYLDKETEKTRHAQRQAKLAERNKEKTVSQMLTEKKQEAKEMGHSAWDVLSLKSQRKEFYDGWSAWEEEHNNNFE